MCKGTETKILKVDEYFVPFEYHFKIHVSFKTHNTHNFIKIYLSLSLIIRIQLLLFVGIKYDNH